MSNPITTRTKRPATDWAGRGGVPNKDIIPEAEASYSLENEQKFRENVRRELENLRRIINKGSDTQDTLDGKVNRAGDTMNGILNLFINSKVKNNGAAHQGGLFVLEKPASGSTLAGDVFVDIFDNLLRIYENGGTFRGISCDLSAQGSQSAILTSASLASQEEAEDGTDNVKMLTPLRAAQGTLAGVRAGLNISGGGTVSYGLVAGFVKWTQRFIVIGDAKGTENAMGSGQSYWDILCPSSGSVDVVGTTAVTATANGIPLGAWQALYYDLDAGSAIGASAFHIVDYSTGTANFVIPPKWVLLCVLNADGPTASALKTTSGLIIPNGSSKTFDQAIDGRTATQITALLDNVVGDAGAGGTKGLVPAPAAGDAAANKFLKASGAWVAVPLGLALLTSGTVSSAATLDIVLTAYTAYKGIRIVLSDFVPATDDVELWMRVSTNGGSTYDASASNYRYAYFTWSESASGVAGSAAATEIRIAGTTAAGLAVSNVAGEGGADVIIDLLSQTDTGNWPRVLSQAGWLSGTGPAQAATGHGQRVTAQDTDAVRFLFESGNIASGKYAVYGLV